jgi:low affinity Fe/Cu permease
MSEPAAPADSGRSAGSRLLWAVDRWASRPLTALIVITADIAWVLFSVAVGFPARWESVFQALVAAITLAMVFVIQHTQSRQQAATQRKLDEILRALPGADNSLLTLEHASDDELRATGHAHREIRRAALDEQSGQASPGRLQLLHVGHQRDHEFTWQPVRVVQITEFLLAQWSAVAPGHHRAAANEQPGKPLLLLAEHRANRPGIGALPEVPQRLL